MPNTSTQADHWTLDRKVPAALIIGILLQTATIVWWASTTDSRISHLEQADIRMLAERDARRTTVDARFELLYRDRDRLTRVETVLDNIVKSIDHIDKKLDQIK